MSKNILFIHASLVIVLSIIVISANSVEVYLKAIMLAAFGVKVIGGVVAEWQVDEVKECALKLKGSEIDHMSLPELVKDG